MKSSTRIITSSILALLLLTFIVMLRRDQPNFAYQPGELSFTTSAETEKELTDTLVTNTVDAGDTVWMVSKDSGLQGLNDQSGVVVSTIPLPDGWLNKTTYISDRKGKYLLLTSSNNLHAIVDVIKQNIRLLPDNIQTAALLSEQIALVDIIKTDQHYLAELTTTDLIEHSVHVFNPSTVVTIIPTDSDPFVDVSPGDDAQNGPLYRYNSQTQLLVAIPNVIGYAFAASPDGNTIYYNRIESLSGRNLIISYYYTVASGISTRLSRPVITSINTWGDNQTMYTVLQTPKNQFQPVVIQQKTVTPLTDRVFDSILSLTPIRGRLLINTGDRIESINL